MDRIKVCIYNALRKSPCTFEEIIRKCAGVYPTLVKQVLDELCIYSSLVPLYKTQSDLVPYDITLKTDYQQDKLATYQVDNNPVLSNWYFSWHSCQKIAQLDLWHNKRILFLGTPRLFEFFAIQDKAEYISLIDFDNVVIDKLNCKYGKSKNILIEHKDINFLTPSFENKYDYIFFDPPWYVDSYICWLKTAAKMVTPNGKIVFPLFPYMTRPTASQERNTLFKISRQISSNVLLIPEFIEYDIPSFEENQLHFEGIDLRANWKVSDLLILQGVSNTPKDCDNIKVNTEYLSWQEFNWFGIRWFVKTDDQLEKHVETMTQPLIKLFDNSIYLKSPSRQNPNLKKANVLSSKGHGFYVLSPERFVHLMERIACTSQEDSLSTIWTQYPIDDESKKIIEELRGKKQ